MVHFPPLPWYDQRQAKTVAFRRLDRQVFGYYMKLGSLEDYWGFSHPATTGVKIGIPDMRPIFPEITDTSFFQHSTSAG